MKNKLILLIFALTLIIGMGFYVNALGWSGNVNYNHGLNNDTASGTTTAKLGVTINSTVIISITSLQKFLNDDVTNGYILNETFATVATCSFVGSWCTFASPYTLTINKNYTLATDNGGSSSKRARFNAASYPISTSGVNWIACYRGDASCTGTELYDIQSFNASGSGVTLNYPANNNFSSSSLNSFSASVDITGSGQTLTNISLFVDNVRVNLTTGLGGATSTQIWQNTISDGAHNWSAQACASDGTCGLSENRTITVDTALPTISITAPTGTISYGYTGQNVTLNATITDTNLNTCWFNYNGTNRTFSCTSGVPAISSFIKTAQNNLIIYANDTAGNVNSSSFSWDYSIYENSRTYTNPAYETALDTYAINVTSLGIITAGYLNYNGIEYTASATTTGYYVNSLTIPAVAADINKSVYWRFVYSGTNITTYSSNQLVQPIKFFLCNATYNIPMINFTTKSATNPFPLVNTTFKIAWAYSLSSGATQKNYSYEDLTATKSNYGFCSNANLTLTADADIDYDSGAYAINFYYLNGANISTLATQTIPLYLLNDSAATATVLKVQDQAQTPKPDHTIQVQFYDIGTGTFYTVSMAKTDFQGQDTVYLNWYDSLYRFIILDSSGNTVKSTGTTKISATPTILTLEDDITFEMDKFNNFQYNLSFQNSTGNFVLTYTKPSGLVQSVCLQVVKQQATGNTEICDVCETSSSATLFCNINAYGNGTYLANFYATGSWYNGDWLFAYVGGDFQDSIYDLLGNKDASFYAFMFATLTVFAFFFNPIIGIIALLGGILGASALGFTALNWGTFMSIAVVGGLIIWLMKK